MIYLSIIIPVYNVEKYIGRCVESCLKQDFPQDEYELLIVNDGSSDGSMEVVRQYARQTGNIRIIEQENAGLSAARNTGIKEAKGEYLWFVDSDDDIKQDVLKQLVYRADSQRLDVLCFGINVIKENETYVYSIYAEKEDFVYDGVNFISKVIMPASACVALYRTEFLLTNGLYFKVGIVHEDQEFTPRAYCMAKRISYINVPAYNYWVRSGSIMTSPEKRAKKAKDLLVICDSLYQFTRERIEEDSAAYNTMIGKINFAFSQSLRNYTKGVSTIAEYKNKPYYPLDISVEGEKRNRWKYRLINFSIPLYLLVHRVLKRER